MTMRITTPVAVSAAQSSPGDLEYLERLLAIATNNKARTQYRDLIWRLKKAQAAKVAS